MLDNQLDFFAKKLKTVRKQKKRTQSQMAKDLNISQNVISQYENGKKKPSIERLKIIADVYDVDMNWFFKDSNIAIGDIHVLEEDKIAYRDATESSTEKEILLSIDSRLKEQTILLNQIKDSKC